MSQQVVVRKAKNHLFGHFERTIGTDQSGIVWECPHCGVDTYGYERDAVVERIKDHLFTHYDEQLAADVHVVQTIGGSGNILLESSKQTAIASSACLHLLTPSRISTQGVLLVTVDPKPQLETWRKHLDTWPKALTIITPRAVSDDRLDEIPSEVEVLTLSGGIDLQKLGVTIARALQSLADSTRKVAIGFDILSEVIRKFELKVVFRFLNILTRQIAKTDAVAHFHLNPQRHSPVELNLVHSQSDLTITTADDLLLSDG